MKLTGSYKYISIDEYSATPKYVQLTNSILSAIEAGHILKDDILPSICDISTELEISRDTVEKAYRNLKNLGVLTSIPGRGFYILDTAFRQNLKVCLLFNKLSVYKKIVYDSFLSALGPGAATDLFIYNNDFSIFKNLLEDKIERYSHFVIIPHFIEGKDQAYEVINTIPKQKLILLDKRIPGIKGDYAGVYEDFENDIYQSLEEACPSLTRYHTLKLIFPANSYYPEEIVNGFSRFCQHYAFSYQVVSDVSDMEISEGAAYINLLEDDLVTLIEKIQLSNLKIGEQVGIISYNEAPIKRVILNGITTISTDFSKMGTLAAGLILRNSHEHIDVPFHLTLRDSL
jgi:DNA-binding transcriptional regulator YhcF (GntR family)